MNFYGTLGNGCGDGATLLAMFRAGMTGLRLNLSHTSLTENLPFLREVYFPAAREAGLAAPHLIADLQGPEVRVGTLPAPLTLSEGETLTLGQEGIPVPPVVLSAARPGQQISLDDSALLLEVTGVFPRSLSCRVVRGGVLRSRKSLAILGQELDLPVLTPEDLANLDAAGQAGVTHVLQSFVRSARDVEQVREELRCRGLAHIRIMAKIENRQGLAHLEEILPVCDEICIARGDLGNAIPLWQLPRIQKDIARRCVRAGVPFCLVTQLLWSMEQRAVPTRAEVSDIYNGVLDGAASLMLTGETAVGAHPVQAMEYLVRTSRTALEDIP